MKWIAAISIAFFGLVGWMRKYTGLAFLMLTVVFCLSYFKADFLSIYRESKTAETAKELRIMNDAKEKRQEESAERERIRVRKEIKEAEELKILIEAQKIEKARLETEAEAHKAAAERAKAKAARLAKEEAEARVRAEESEKERMAKLEAERQEADRRHIAMAEEARIAAISRELSSAARAVTPSWVTLNLPADRYGIVKYSPGSIVRWGNIIQVAVWQERYRPDGVKVRWMSTQLINCNDQTFSITKIVASNAVTGQKFEDPKELPANMKWQSNAISAYLEVCNSR